MSNTLHLLIFVVIGILLIGYAVGMGSDVWPSGKGKCSYNISNTKGCINDPECTFVNVKNGRVAYKAGPKITEYKQMADTVKCTQKMHEEPEHDCTIPDCKCYVGTCITDPNKKFYGTCKQHHSDQDSWPEKIGDAIFGEADHPFNEHYKCEYVN